MTESTVTRSNGAKRPRTLLLDILPELYPYRDDGCEVSPSCLRCPLPRCKYDDPAWYHRQRRLQRDVQIHQARLTAGLTVPELARRFGVSQRTVFRALQVGRTARFQGPGVSRQEPEPSSPSPSGRG